MVLLSVPGLPAPGREGGLRSLLSNLLGSSSSALSGGAHGQSLALAILRQGTPAWQGGCRDLRLTAATGSGAAGTASRAENCVAPSWQELSAGKDVAVALLGWSCGTRNGLVLTARVPPSGLTLVPPRVGNDSWAGGWDMPCASLGGFITGHKPVCGREAIKWAACSLCPQARSNLVACQLLALPHSSRDTHPEGQPCARTHALPAAASVPGCGPPAHCKATTGSATLLAQAPV